MEDSENSNNNYSFYQSFCKEKKDEEDENNSRTIQTFISKNNSNIFQDNSNNLEDIIFRELEENKKSYLDNGIYFKRKIEGSNPNTKRGKNNSLFNSDSNSENNEKTNISRSDQLLSMNKHNIFKSLNPSNNLQYSPNKNYIPDSDEEKEKEKNDYEENQSESININNEQDSISIRISNPKDINNDNDNDVISRGNSNKIFISQNDLLSSLKDINFPKEKRFSIINNFSKLNSILSSRNTISYLEKPHYQLLAYTFFNHSNRDTNKSIRISFSSKQSVNYSEQARIIQKWWRNVKAICDDKLNKIIKIQSVWRGKCSRKYMFEIIYLCYSCQCFCDILSKIIKNRIKLIWKFLISRNNKENSIVMKAKKLFNRYQYIKPFFEKWKCLNKLILYKIDINRNTIITKRKIILKGLKEIDKFKKYYDVKTQDKDQLMQINCLKMLYFNIVYLKLRMNKIRYVFDCLNQFNLRSHFRINKYRNSTKINLDNYSTKKYFLYKWRNITKNLEINELKEKFLIYLLNKYFKKSANNTLNKYLSRWKLFADDEKTK